jgi:hypothetical protein
MSLLMVHQINFRVDQFPNQGAAAVAVILAHGFSVRRPRSQRSMQPLFAVKRSRVHF